MTSAYTTAGALMSEGKRIFGIKLQWLELLQLLVQRDLRVRYRGSILGYMWSMLNPLLYMLILSAVFSHVVKVKTENYALFILAGIMTWNFFHQSIVIGMNSIIGSGHLLKKVKIPGLLFPTASVTGVLTNFVLSFIPFVIISSFLGNPPFLTLFVAPFFIIIFYAFVWGAVVMISSINVVYRDVGHGMEALLQMLFYATPVVYPPEVIPERFRFIVELNPVAHFLEIFRSLLIMQQIPSPKQILIVCALALASTTLGLVIYRKYRDEFIYRL